MISPEILRRYPIFSGLSLEQITTLAWHAEEIEAEADTTFFREGDTLVHFYLVTEGTVEITVPFTDPNQVHGVASQLTGQVTTAEASLSIVGAGDIFGWSGLIPPYKATATAAMLTPGRVVAINTEALREEFATDWQFGYLLMEKAAQVISQRLRDQRVQSLAQLIP